MADTKCIKTVLREDIYMCKKQFSGLSKDFFRFVQKYFANYS